ncbi:hypothetical protein K1719_016148 [Acacia pycnantha]|nr:hypothetical protein K1719_016148 [Acacia pycnantha]
MEESSTILDAEVVGIRFSLATCHEISTASINDSSISHASQLSNPFLGLPLEFGRCESCGTSDAEKCEGHFGYVNLPVPIYHPSHISELKKMLSLLCLHCLKMKKYKNPAASNGLTQKLLAKCCGNPNASQVTIREAKPKTADGASYLELKVSKSKMCPGFWNFLQKYGYRYESNNTRALLPYEAMEIIKRIPPETRKKLVGKGYFPQEGYILKQLPVPLIVCLFQKFQMASVSYHRILPLEAAELQSVVHQYFEVRGTSKAARVVEAGVNKELNDSATKAWMEKMKTLFIRKGSGFSSRSVITGESYKSINEVGIPWRESSKGHIYLRLGQIVHRRIMDGDTVFINRPPTTHKHSLQALSVYIHDDHTVKINPLICAPLGADFDGDCIHLFYPQSLAAKAEVLELFSLEKQLLSSHSGNLNLQLTTDSLLSLKMLFKRYFLAKVEAHQLAMFISPSLPQHALVKAYSEGACWTAVQMLQSVLPSSFDCAGGQYLICRSEILRFDFNRDILPTMINEIAASIFFGKGPEEVMRFYNVLQPFLMESLFVEGFSVSLKDFFMYGETMRSIKRSIGRQDILLKQLRSIYNELVQQQLEKCIHDVKKPIINFILKSGLGDLIDSKSESAIDKLVQQIGFLGVQLSDRGKFYSKTLVEDMASHFNRKYYDRIDYPSAEFGLLKGCFFHGLDPYEEMVHSISAREILVRSSRGLSEPGTLFKNLMAILRDVVICYDGTVRNVCSNSVIEFEYGVKAGDKNQLLFPPGEPVGVLAATAMSNPAYKAVLDATPNSNSSWELMKEILVCKVGFKNEAIDRRVILYLNDCGCGKLYCRENAAYVVKNQLRKVSLKEVADEVMIEYQCQRTGNEGPETDAGLVGHIYLNKVMLKEKKINMAEVAQRCEETLKPYRKKKQLGHVFKKIELFCSESSAPCVSFIWRDGDAIDDLAKTVYILAEVVCSVLLETIIKGDARIISANIIWVNPDSNMWVHNPYKSPKGELALEIILEKTAVKQSGDAWRIVLDSCVPVLHLIDTTRSIPYAIKQVEELLGISCVFDQVIQRLASSVKRVAKGVLREHLILLASSMTCGGSLVGFNTGGYKALGKQLTIQNPFTDATLFTPRRCFEQAAEKCHMDTLSSIVASCSWGKRVAVGTGSGFEVLWDAKEVKSDDIDLDVYNFLHMVRSTAQEKVNNDGCLGEDVDELFAEDYELSPERDSGTEAVFETQVQDDSWRSNKWTEGQNNDDSAMKKSASWSSWTKNKPETGEIDSERAEDSVGFDKWTAKQNDDDYTGEKSSGWSSWAKNKPERGDIGPERAENDSWGSRFGKNDGHSSHDQEDNRSWGTSKSPALPTNQGWAGNSHGWDSQKATASDSGRDQWGKQSTELFKKNPEPKDASQGPGFGRNDGHASHDQEDNCSWARSKSAALPATQGWGGSSHGWGSPNAAANDSGSDQWGKQSTKLFKKNPEPQDDSQGPGSGKNGGQSSHDQEDNCSWEDPSPQHCKQTKRRELFKENPEPQDDSQGPGFGKNDSCSSHDQEDSSSWARSKSPALPANQGWGGSSRGWDSQNATPNDSDRDQWGKQSRELFKKNPSDGSQGWGSHAGEWKNKTRPPRTPGANRDTNIGGLFTATRQRLDMFTSEEQDILKDVEPIMQNIRRIMQQSGYNDGDPLAAEDQTFVIENVFEHHPDKAAKMGAGIDYVMVSRHTNFQDSRCFYLVLKDGQKQDFSYRKCLDNFLKTKYPEMAEEFGGKYFRKRKEQNNPPPTPINEQNPPPTPTNEHPPPTPTNEEKAS